MSESTKKVMVFGVFDCLHDGHLHFLSQAKEYGEVVTVVARDTAVKELKSHLPLQTEEERRRALEKLPFVGQTILGDEIQGTYEVIKKYTPDVICVGYDQEWLKKDLTEKMNTGELPEIELIQISSYRPEELHTSLLIKNAK